MAGRAGGAATEQGRQVALCPQGRSPHRARRDLNCLPQSGECHASVSGGRGGGIGCWGRRCWGRRWRGAGEGRDLCRGSRRGSGDSIGVCPGLHVQVEERNCELRKSLYRLLVGVQEFLLADQQRGQGLKCLLDHGKRRVRPGLAPAQSRGHPTGRHGDRSHEEGATRDR